MRFARIWVRMPECKPCDSRREMIPRLSKESARKKPLAIEDVRAAVARIAPQKLIGMTILVEMFRREE